MTKYNDACFAVFAAVIVFLCGCGSVPVSGEAEPYETSPAISLPSVNNARRDEASNDAENAGSAGTAIYTELNRPLPSASVNGPVITPAVTSMPSHEPVPTANPVSVTEGARPEFANPIKSFNDDSRVCLTFDDGGNREAVEKVLEVLRKHEVKATFFVIGEYLEPHEDLWKRAVDEGHLVCNHTQNHKWITQLNDDEARNEILEWEKNAADILGQEYVERMKHDFPFIRLPGGSGNGSERVLKLVSELGYIPVGWNIETYYSVLRHHNLKTEETASIADEILDHVLNKVKGGSIVLLHFNPYDTAKLDELIAAIKEKGLAMHLLSECIGY